MSNPTKATLSIGKAIRRMIVAGIFPNYQTAGEALGDRLEVPGLTRNMTTESKLAEVWKSFPSSKS